MKRVISFFLITVLLLSVLYITAFAGSSGIASVSASAGCVTVTFFPYSQAGDVWLKITTTSGTTVYTTSKPFNGSSLQFAIPERSFEAGDYIIYIYYYCDGILCDSETISYSSSVQSATNTAPSGAPRANTPEKSRAVLVPYANVYSDSSMSSVIIKLKRYDLVNVYSYSGNIAHVGYQIQSGHGTLTTNSNIDAVYSSPDDVCGRGYMYISDLCLEHLSTLSSAERQRYAVELAYTRLGLKGPYSQPKRFTDYYLDCAAYVCWCWYNAGVDWSMYGTAVSGAESWADNTHNTLIWSAQENQQTAQTAFSAQAQGTPAPRTMGSIIPEYDDGRYIIPSSSRYAGHNISQSVVNQMISSVESQVGTGSYTLQQAYAELILNNYCFRGQTDLLSSTGRRSTSSEQAVYAALNGIAPILNSDVSICLLDAPNDYPAVHIDSYYFCYSSDIAYRAHGETYSTDTTVTSYGLRITNEVFEQMQPGDLIVFNNFETVTTEDGEEISVQVNEGNYGGDHIAMFVKYDSVTNTATILESSIASENPSANTKESIIRQFDGRRNQIIKIIRPTGGALISGGEAVSTIDYSYLRNNQDEMQLRCPVSGSFTVIQSFSSTNPNMAIQTPLDKSVYCAEDGIVSSVTQNGNTYTVAVTHSDGLKSSYGNLAVVYVSSGQVVTRNQILGKTAVNPSSTGNGLLIFTVYKDGSPVDPALYMQ